MGAAVIPRGRNGALTLLTLAIVVLATAAFVRAQALKQEDPPISGIEIARTLEQGCECPRETARMAFSLRRAQPITAAVVDEDEEPVRTLLDSELRASGRVKLAWDGTDEAGERVPEGEYRLRIDLAVPDRSIVIPDDVRVERSGERQ